MNNLKTLETSNLYRWENKKSQILPKKKEVQWKQLKWDNPIRISSIAHS